MGPELIDPNKPTRAEVAAHNMKIAKANLACELTKQLCLNPTVISQDWTADELARYAISIAETIIETYSLMPDGSGNRGGLVA